MWSDIYHDKDKESLFFFVLKYNSFFKVLYKKIGSFQSTDRFVRDRHPWLLLLPWSFIKISNLPCSRLSPQEKSGMLDQN